MRTFSQYFANHGPQGGPYGFSVIETNESSQNTIANLVKWLSKGSCGNCIDCSKRRSCADNDEDSAWLWEGDAENPGDWKWGWWHGLV